MTSDENHGSLALLAVGYRKQRWHIPVATAPVSLSKSVDGSLELSTESTAPPDIPQAFLSIAALRV